MKWQCALKMVLPLAALALGFGLSCEKDSPPPDSSIPPVIPVQTLPKVTLQIAGQPFTLELAVTRPARTRGLMFRKDLAPDTGMLFVFSNSQPRSFYMKNCLIDLDLIYLDPQGKIVSFTTMKMPVPGRPLQTYPSTGPAQYVIELSAGTAARLNLKSGQSIPLPRRVLTIIPEPD